MASQSRKHRGYASQRIVAEYLREQGWPFAESAGAGRPGTDVTGIVGVDIEVKARRGLSLTGLVAQQALRAADGVIPVGVIRPDGYGPARIAEWPAVMPLSVLVILLHEAGYGNATFS
jgi:hypothetical protein